MPELNAEVSASSIVLVGSFNPKIFQPEWFARQNLLSESEVATAEIKVIAPQICQFETERFILQALLERFTVTSKPSANGAFLGDLVLGTFYTLEHTPATAMGLNHHMHFAVSSEEEWHKIGDRLAPQAPWSEVLEGRPGMMSLTINSPKPELPGALFSTRVEPSMHVKPGVYFETNEHYPVAETGGLKSLMDVLSQRWKESDVYANRVVEHILTWAKRTS